jgi:hypothetical protein
MSKFRLWLERLGLVLITFLALGTPLALGLFGYLALGDGIDFSSDNPLRASRVWMIRESRRMTGLGMVTQSSATPADTGLAGLQCARTHFTALLWSPDWQLDRNSQSCTCYTTVDGRLRDSKTPCAP